METQFGYHYATMSCWKNILKCSLVKSRALLLSEALQQREDWQRIKTDPKALATVLPDYMRHPDSFLTHAPVLWFSRDNFWESQAGAMNEVKAEDDPDMRHGYISMREAYIRGGGLVRLAMPADSLLSWQELQVAAKFRMRTKLILAFGDWLMGGADRAQIMGFVGESLELKRIERVDVFLPFADTLKGEWLPLMAPSSPDCLVKSAEYFENITSAIAARGLVPMETIRALGS
jgi:hypothetical protein